MDPRNYLSHPAQKFCSAQFLGQESNTHLVWNLCFQSSIIMDIYSTINGSWMETVAKLSTPLKAVSELAEKIQA